MSTFGFVSEDTFAEKMDAQNTLLAAIAANSGDSLRPTNWKSVQAIVRAGLADKVFAVGDQFVCSKGDDTIVWDVIDFDHDVPVNTDLSHSMTLMMHYGYTPLQFDAREAFYYCSEILSAGTHYFKVGRHPWYPNDTGIYIEFTTVNTVPAGGQLVINQAANVSLVGGTISTYASNTSTTPIDTVNMSVWSGDASDNNLGEILDEKQTNLNTIDRSLHGNNNYKESAIRQMLNSDKAAGTFWTAQNVWDRPPVWNATQNGFLYDLDEDFVEVMGKVKQKTQLNSVCDGGGNEETDELFYIPSQEEVYMGRDANVDENGPYKYFSMFSSLSSAWGGPDTNRIKYNTNGAAIQWYLRTPGDTTASSVRIVYSTGEKTGQYVENSTLYWLVPVCNIV